MSNVRSTLLWPTVAAFILTAALTPGLADAQLLLNASANGSASQPVITLELTSKAHAGVGEGVEAQAARDELPIAERARRENYREFSRAKISQAAAPELFTLEFHAATKLSGIKATADFRVSGGTCIEGHQYAAGAVCNVEVTFTPAGPGHRTGQLAITHSAAATPFLTPLGGTGYGPAISFTPSQILTVLGSYAGSGASAGGTLLNAQGLAVDGGDNLYIADTGNNLIKFRDSGGVISSLVGGGSASAVGYDGFGPGIKLTSPRGVAVDYSGTFYIADTGDSVVLVRYIDGILNTRIGGGATASSCSFSSPCLPYDVKITSPYSIATDSAGNVYTTLQVGGSLPGFYLAENEADNNHYYLLSTTAYNYYSTSSAIAVDSYSNVYYTYEDPGGPLLSPTPLCYILGQNRSYSNGQGGGYRFWTIAGSGPCGFSGDGGKATGAEISTSINQFALDAAGNLYFADTGNNRVRRVDAYNGVIRTVAGSGAKGFTGDGGPSTSASIERPTGLAVDSTGQVYTTGIANSTQNSGTGLNTDLRMFGTVGSLSFGTVAVGSHSAAQTVLVSNVGNDTLNFTHAGFTAGTGDYAIDPNTTSCNFTVPLYSGRNCNIGLIFTPSAAGGRAATLTLADDTVSGSNTIQMLGTGATTVTLTPASIAFPVTTLGMQSSPVVATLTNTGKSALTITVAPAFSGTNATSFKNSTTCGTTLAVGASCTVSVVFAPTVAGAMTASLVIRDNATTLQQTVLLTGTAVAASAKALISPTAQAFSSQQVSTLSAARAIKLSNPGTAALGVSAFALSGANAADFSYAKNCGATVAIGAYCTINVTFKPAATGARSAVLTVTTSVGKVTVTLTGTAIALASIKSAVSLVAKVNPAVLGQAVIFTSRVTGAQGKPTGKVQVKEEGRVLAESVLSNGVATLELSNLSSGTHVLNAVYEGDSEFMAATSGTVRQMIVRPIHRPHVVN